MEKAIFNVTKPNNDLNQKFLEEAINKFEERFKKEDMSKNYFHLVIVGEYDRSICNEIEKIYSEVGWKNVKCRTSSENGERGGLTGLILQK